jgi:soluble P-type ATPase
VVPSNAMLRLSVPHVGELALQHLVCDVNGTLAIDGELQAGVADALRELRSTLDVHLLTSDTHGGQDAIDAVLGLPAVRIPSNQPAATAKLRYVEQLGAHECIAVGNGRNDVLMLRAARLAVVVAGPEGAAAAALAEADVVVTSGHAALALLLHPQRLVATLRG